MSSESYDTDENHEIIDFSNPSSKSENSNNDKSIK